MISRPKASSSFAGSAPKVLAGAARPPPAIWRHRGRLRAEESAQPAADRRPAPLNSILPLTPSDRPGVEHRLEKLGVDPLPAVAASAEHTNEPSGCDVLSQFVGTHHEFVERP